MVLTQERRDEIKAMAPEQQAEVFGEMARQWQAEHGGNFRQACFEVKRRFPEAREAFAQAGPRLPV